ncbi:hypothetical protein Tco_0945773 [Tanacetum coccineum]
MNVFMRIGVGSTSKLVSLDDSQVVTFDGKFVCGFRNGDCGTGSRSGNTVADRQFSGVEVDCFFVRMELFCFVDEVFDSEYVQATINSLEKDKENLSTKAGTSGGVFGNQGQASGNQAGVSQVDMVGSQAFDNQANGIETQTSVVGSGKRVNSVQGGAINHAHTYVGVRPSQNTHTNAGNDSEWASF